jgi:ATP-dependent Clp endopeptidase proteolytic subunit ClpP
MYNMFGGNNKNKRKLTDIYFGGERINKSKKNDNVHESDDDDNSSIADKITNAITGSKKGSGEKIERDNNHIYFYSEVNRDSIYDLIMLIKEAEEESILTSLKLKIDEIPIYIHINSLGGSIFNCFAGIDIIQLCKVPVHTIIEGGSASAGTLLSVVGKKRYMTKNAYMLIHQLSSGFWGKMGEIEDEFKNLEDLMKRIKDIYKEHTTIPKKELNDLLKHDLWLDSDKCLKYGLVDEIWTK